MSKTMKNTASITIPASKLQVGDLVVDEIGMPPVRIRAVKLDPRAALIVASLTDGGSRCYLKDKNVVALRSFSKLTKAQLTKALKAVQKQQNSLACQAGDLQDALAKIERKAATKKGFRFVEAHQVAVGQSGDEVEDHYGEWSQVRSSIRGQYRDGRQGLVLCLANCREVWYARHAMVKVRSAK